MKEFFSHAGSTRTAQCLWLGWNRRRLSLKVDERIPMRIMVGAGPKMDVKLKAVIAVVVTVTLLGGASFILIHRSSPAVTVLLQISVTPSDQVGFVTGRANSAQFKYLVGKQSGIQPALAQKLALKPLPQSALVEARIRGLTEDESRRFIEAFVPTLQDLCGQQAQLSLAAQSLR